MGTRILQEGGMISGPLTIFLPVSLRCLASLLACSATQIPHHLFIAGVCSNRRRDIDIKETKSIGIITTSSLLENLNLTDSQTLHLEEEDILKWSQSEDNDLSPLFVLYSGGETSMIAGMGEETGYYQVASC